MISVDLRWRSGFWNVALLTPDGRSFSFARSKVTRVPRTLSHYKVEDRFRAMIEARPDFRNWWIDQTGGESRIPIRFSLNISEGPWEIPWELMLLFSQDRQWNRVSLTRRIGEDTASLPHTIDHPLRIQIVKGDNSGRAGVRLDLDKEVGNITERYDALEHGVKRNIEVLETIQPTIDEFREQMTRSQADILWFSGHAVGNDPAFFLSGSGDGAPYRLSPQEMAELVSLSPVPTMYIVFWACETGARSTSDTARHAPAFCKALLDVGVHAVLAMQAPIGDSAAIDMTKVLFRQLAAGDSIDVALAHARAELRETSGEDVARPLDWACPVLWSSCSLPDRLEWTDESLQTAQRQIASRSLLLASAAAPAIADISPSETDRARARDWRKSARLWVVGDPSKQETAHTWLGALMGIQCDSDSAVIIVELQQERLDESVRVWAEKVLATLDVRLSPHPEFRSLLVQLRDDPRDAWPRFCSLDGTVLAISDSHARVLENWFFDPLDTDNAANTYILRPDSDDETARLSWPVEDPHMQPLDTEKLAEVRSAHATVVHALAVIGTPVRETWVTSATPLESVRSALSGLLVETNFGLALSAAAAEEVERDMSPPETVAAHRLCMRILDHRDVRTRLSPEMRALRLMHALGAGEAASAALEALALFASLHSQDRPRALMYAFSELGSMQRRLPSNALIYVAWSYLKAGKVSKSKLWLDRSTPTNIIERAWIHGLRAEIDKSEGKRNEALTEVEEAIAVLEQTTGDKAISRQVVARRLRSYRQDKARILQYLFYKPEDAILEYDQLLDEWAGEVDAQLDIAVVKRNYSEAIRQVSSGPGDPRWREARGLLVDAIASLRSLGDPPVLSELHYERARIAISEGEDIDARALLERCVLSAENSGHTMMKAIAKNRLFWEFEKFDESTWMTIESNLNAHAGHGWCVRVLLNSRLTLAKRFANAGDVDKARKALERNLSLIGRNPSLEQGSDRFRIAATHAGLTELSADRDEPSWNEFLESRDWSVDWLREQGLDGPTQVWGRV